MNQDDKLAIDAEGTAVLIPSNSRELEMQKICNNATSDDLKPFWGALVWN